MSSATSTAYMMSTTSPACASHLWSASARPREVMSAAIAETGLSSFREILRLGTIAEIEGIASSTAICLRFHYVCLLHLRLRLLARTFFESLLNLANIGLGLGPLGSTAKICTSRFTDVQRLLPGALAAGAGGGREG